MGTQCKHPVLFIVDDFLEPHQCVEIRSEAKQSQSVPAKVTRSESRVDIDQRRTSRVFVSAESQLLVSRLLKEVLPQLVEHYKAVLSGCENPQFLLYRPGDFYKAHRDKTDSPNSPQYIKDRRVSVVVFLSTEDQAGGYTGGSLVIYGVLPGLEFEKIGFRFQGKEGQLIAFPSDLKHEVEPVLSGERYSIVSWYF